MRMIVIWNFKQPCFSLALIFQTTMSTTIFAQWCGSKGNKDPIVQWYTSQMNILSLAAQISLGSCSKQLCSAPGIHSGFREQP